MGMGTPGMPSVLPAISRNWSSPMKKVYSAVATEGVGTPNTLKGLQAETGLQPREISTSLTKLGSQGFITKEGLGKAAQFFLVAK